MAIVIQVSESVLGRMVTRSFRFLVGLARSPRLMATMRSRGFTPEVQAQGWALIDTISGRGATPAAAPGESDESVERAIEGIDVWVTTNVPILKATLRHRFPEQYAFLFTDDVTVAHGNDAVRTAATLVARFEAMTSAPEREATRADDAAALALIATRGITVADRTRLATRVRLVQHVGAATKASGDGVPSVAPPAKDDPRVDLYVWFTEWSEIGRVVIARRADLIKLGLASPRRARAADGEEGDEEGSDDEDVIDAKDDTQDDAKVAEEPSVAAAPAKATAPKRAAAKPSPRGTPSSAPSPA
jgi:hypothetical protein